MMQQLLLYPLLFQLFLSIFLMFFWKKIDAQKIISIVGGFIAVFLSGVLFYTVWNSGIQTVQAAS